MCIRARLAMDGWWKGVQSAAEKAATAAKELGKKGLVSLVVLGTAALGTAACSSCSRRRAAPTVPVASPPARPAYCSMRPRS